MAWTIMILSVMIMVIGGCTGPKLNLFSDEPEPLREFTLEGTKKDKVLVIPVEGVITDAPEKRFLRPKPGKVQEIVSQLRLAEKDKNVKAVLFKIDSPGGSTTASDILYHEIMKFKEETDVPVIALIMSVAASGGYYIASACDFIIANDPHLTKIRKQNVGFCRFRISKIAKTYPCSGSEFSLDFIIFQ